MSPLPLQHHHLRTRATFLWGIFICSFVLCHLCIYWFTNLPSSIFFYFSSFPASDQHSKKEPFVFPQMVSVNQTSGWWKLGPWKTSQVVKCPSHALGLLPVGPGRKQRWGEKRASGKSLSVQKGDKKLGTYGTLQVIVPAQVCIGLSASLGIFPSEIPSSQSVSVRQGHSR